MKENYAKELLKKYNAGECTPEEKELVESWYLHHISSQQDEEAHPEYKLIKNEIWDRIKGERPVSSKRRMLIPQIAAAALIIIAAAFTVYSYISQKHIGDEIQQEANAIIPGGNKAVLTLADGRQIILDNAEKGVLASQGHTAVSKTHDGQLVYDVSAEKPVTDNPRLAYNTITTPRGGQYMIILPDGTKVWLNAVSSLKFPVMFSGGKREVELTGEAYFEVAKMIKGNKEKGERLPFIVNSGEQQIEVLGTHFNVMAYEDESAVKTTLLEGSVKVSNLKSQISNLLKPGQQSSMNRAGVIKVAEVNTEEAAAWKNGYFMFANENIKSIMNKISRWYDVDVVYQGNVKDKALWGTISRFENVGEVLKMMELTGIIHFKIEGRRITVMP